MNQATPTLMQRTPATNSTRYPHIKGMCSIALSSLVFLATFTASAAEPAFEREMDIIYHKQGGFALTMDKVVPKEYLNRAAVIFVVSGGWYSDHAHGTKDDAPTLMLHGEHDEIVPFQQAQRISTKFQESGIPTKLHIKEGTSHVWGIASEEEIQLFADWFDTHLLK